MHRDHLAPPSSRSWCEWRLDEWNAALLRSFFSSGDITGPVTRLLVTRKEFTRVAAVAEHDADAALEAFLTVIRHRLEGPPSRSLMVDAHRLASWWCVESSTVPPFLSHLFVTCLAASDVIPGATQFRKRISALLRADLTQHGLIGDSLTKLWRQLAQWLRFQRDCGDTSLRLIELPSLRDVGSLKIIGVSVWLAFPSARDRRQLMSTLDDAVVDPTAPDVTCVVKAVRRRELSFTSRFRRAFAEFMEAYTDAVPDCDRLPFWMAVRDCVGTRAAELRRDRGVATVIAEADEDDKLSVFVLANDVAVARSPWPARPLAMNVRECGYVLTATGDDLSSVNEIAAGFVPSLSARIAEGLVLFQQDEDAYWTFSPTLRDDAPAQMLVRHDRLPPMSTTAAWLDIRRSRYENWFEVRCDDVGSLRALFGHSTQNGFSTFAQSITSANPTIIGGIRIDGGWLGRRSFLPVVVCSAATGVTACDEFGRTVELVPSHGSRWSFPAKDIFGAVTVRATLPSGDDRVRIVRFYRDVVGDKYAQPREGRWLCETSATDLVDYSADALMIVGDEGAAWLSATVTTDAYPTTTAGEDLESDDLLTALAVMSKSGGIPEKTVVDTVGRVEPREASAWGVIRALVEIGVFNRLVDKHWRAASYFAVAPHLVIFPRGASWAGVVVGLVQPAVRNAVIAAANKYRLDVRLKGGTSRVVPALIHITASTPAHLCDVADACGLEVRQVKPLAAIVQSVPLTQIPRAAPLNFRHHATWSWTSRSFVEARSESTSDIGVNWHRRDDMPDVFTVDQGRRTLFESRSRTWALLVGYALRSEASFKPTATGLQSVASAVVLPLPIARLATITGRHLPNHEPGQNTYCFGSETVCRAVIARLWQTRRTSSAVAWLRQALRSGYFDGGPSVAASGLATLRLPPEVREALVQRTSVPVELLPILHSLSRSGIDN